ncbi:hypothetical protein HGRIS_007060 [Hohenbuehelia grisea]|uniref:beta-glucosidase n=1 Tax=Hohenbuehelia grisea TaxID=104357 RepID=A0ABR3JAX6_9AGAR
MAALVLFLAVSAVAAQQSSLSLSTTALDFSATSATKTSVESVLTSVSASVSEESAVPKASPSSTKPELQSPVPSIPITQYTFSPFPTPSQESVPGVFVKADPSNPPAVNAPVVPNFGPAWATAYAKAKKLISTFSLEEKINVTTGAGWMGGLCVGNIAAVKEWPGLCLQDSPLGVRLTDFVTAFPTGINTAATFNRRFMRLRGLFMGREFVGKGVNIALGPMMNLARVAQAGRNWEGFGADPYLAGEAAYETILGMQEGGVQACAKHIIANEQEHHRATSSSNVDDRTQHEVYGHPFLRSVMAGVASVMCSYNQLNGTYACENDKILNDLLKREYGFQGYVLSDWEATHSTISAIAGLDMTMPGDAIIGDGDSYFGANLTSYVQNGTIPESRIDDMATRIIAGWYLLKQDSKDYPAPNFNAFYPDDEATNKHVDVQAEGVDKLVREIGAASTVLLKNKGNVLPLKKPRSLVVVGNDAGSARNGPNGFTDQAGVDGVLAMGWGSGTANFSYLISPLEAIQARARKDRTSVSWFLNDWDTATAGNVVIGKTAALVFVNANSGEHWQIIVDGNDGDRNNLTAWNNGDELIRSVAAQNNNTIVIAHSVGPLIVEPWIDHPNITAVLWAGLAGTETGNAITDVLYGDWNPSGRLPYTMAKKVEDYSAQLIIGENDKDIVAMPYTEGLEIDYRHFDAKNITPRFEFGFGLSYTKFSYADLKVERVANPGQGELEKAWEQGKAGPRGQGSSAAVWLHRPAFRVSFNVKNIGKVFGGDIPQLYVNFPKSSGEPPSVLKGFSNVELQPGQTKSVELLLSRYDLSIWDTVAQGWRKPEGAIDLSVGASSRDLRLKGRVPV